MPLPVKCSPRDPDAMVSLCTATRRLTPLLTSAESGHTACKPAYREMCRLTELPQRFTCDPVNSSLTSVQHWTARVSAAATRLPRTRNPKRVTLEASVSVYHAFRPTGMTDLQQIINDLEQQKAAIESALAALRGLSPEGAERRGPGRPAGKRGPGRPPKKRSNISEGRSAAHRRGTGRPNEQQQRRRQRRRSDPRGRLNPLAPFRSLSGAQPA